ncbi:hypothetical protein A0H81_00591 [Grifola frondosa]|uniref:Uncharacterized protein n=1 Tax=Grifola frondosa TaxID=5627 RepID=A0A1C7MPF1_GRIFR|nr:hypothetical protein A0H81_00591 [Grifola frondosa]
MRSPIIAFSILAAAAAPALAAPPSPHLPADAITHPRNTEVEAKGMPMEFSPIRNRQLGQEGKPNHSTASHSHTHMPHATSA